MPGVAELCANCSHPKPVRARPHCKNNLRCPWWVCEQCNAANDGKGNNSIRSPKKDTP